MGNGKTRVVKRYMHRWEEGRVSFLLQRASEFGSKIGADHRKKREIRGSCWQN